MAVKTAVTVEPLSKLVYVHVNVNVTVVNAGTGTSVMLNVLPPSNTVPVLFHEKAVQETEPPMLLVVTAREPESRVSPCPKLWILKLYNTVPEPVCGSPS